MGGRHREITPSTYGYLSFVAVFNTSFHAEWQGAATLMRERSND